jgi:acyl dehydratase
MPLDPHAIGRTGEPQTLSWTSTDALLYAVGVGAGTDELAFTTENTVDVAQQVLPTFPVVLNGGSGALLQQIGDYDRAKLVHGLQSVTLEAALPADGTAILTPSIEAMYDKGAGSASVVVLRTDGVQLDGSPLFTTRASLFIRESGGWGGERGPSGAQNQPPDRDPDEIVEYATTPDQALLYRLSGDRNPLHSDPTFAARGGFPAPILHGLCTYGFTGRALLHTVCGSDPGRFASIEGRFSAPVIPGDRLIVRVWRIADGDAVFTTSVGDRAVIDQGRVRHR